MGVAGAQCTVCAEGSKVSPADTHGTSGVSVRYCMIDNRVARARRV